MASAVAGAPPISGEQARWLHDKYERLAADESELISSRTTYYAAIGTVLLTGLLVAVSNLLSHAFLLSVTVSFLAVLGILISLVWIILLHRTVDAQNLWREAALRLEELSPPVTGSLPAPVTLRSGRTMPVDLLQPYHAHRERFAREKTVSWMDRLDPATLTAVLPWTFFGLWISILVVIWSWFFFLA